jgi:hypothetical protein
LIATGAILPGIGGTATRMGYVEVLYVTELIGLILTWIGYRMSVRSLPAAVHRVGNDEEAHAKLIERSVT